MSSQRTVCFNLIIHFGHPLQETKRKSLARQPRSGSRPVEVLDSEVKGDGRESRPYLPPESLGDEYELAVEISNDSDLMLPLSMVRHRLGKRVCLFGPSRRRL